MLHSGLITCDECCVNFRMKPPCKVDKEYRCARMDAPEMSPFDDYVISRWTLFCAFGRLPRDGGTDDQDPKVIKAMLVVKRVVEKFQEEQSNRDSDRK